ncbi:MAG TPA: polysaccharide deacetylase family protein [Candidatus Dormibacteraeota bacterium]|nr:polysaccharide deacetylase family protein [Candidatus Dormibacteraeota bacterium]
MRRRPALGRACAAALIVVALTALAQAVRSSDLTPGHPWPVPTRAGPVIENLRTVAPRVDGPLEVIPAGRATVRVPILEYHYIRVNPDPRDRLGFNLSVTPADFAQQMGWLAADGYHPIDFDDLRGYLLSGGVLPAKPVILTFDDGYRDMFTTALPILHAHGFKAVSYVVSGFLNSPRYLTNEMVLEMEAEGIEIGAHTVSHADLTRISAPNLQHEVFDSKSELEALVGHPVLDFCYPSGKFNDAVVHTIQEAGFQTATTELPGIAHSAGDRFVWTRVRVNGGESLPEFVLNLGQPEPAVVVTPPPAGRGSWPGSSPLPVTFPLRPPSVPVPGPATGGPIP